MAQVDIAAAEILAHHDRVHNWKSEEPGINEAFTEFMEAWMPHAQTDRLHFRLPKEWTAVNRPIHIYAMFDPRRKATLLSLEVNDTYRSTTTPIDTNFLHRAAARGDRGRLAEDGLWYDPRYQGALRMFVWWGNQELWKECARAGRRSSRLAYEALSGGTWENQFQPQPEPVPTDAGRLTNIRALGSERLASLIRRPQAIPIQVLRDRGDATMAQAIAYYLIEDPKGPRMSWRDAALQTGTREWRTLYAALRDRERHQP